MKMPRPLRSSLFGVAALASAVLAGAASADIKIGMTVSSTGRFALAAQSGERGLKIWVDDVSGGGARFNFLLPTTEFPTESQMTP